MSKGYRIPSDFKNDVSKYTHNWRSPAFFTMHPGLAYVTHHRHLNTGDRIRGDLSQLVQSQPMVGPLMQGFRLITIATFTPDSIIYGWMRNGIRYTPQEYMKFDKWYFNPAGFAEFAAGDGGITYQDPSFDDMDNDVESFFIHPGISVNASVDSPTSVDYYNAWKSPTFIEDPSGEVADGSKFSVVGRGGLWDCLGLAPGSVYPAIPLSSGSGYQLVESWNFSVAPLVSYFLSAYYYLANMQEDYMYFSRGAYSLTRPMLSNSSAISSSNLTNLGFHQALCGFDPNEFLQFIGTLSNYTVMGNSTQMNIASIGQLVSTYGSFAAWALMGFQAHGGLFAVPYRPDFFNNIIKVGDAPSVSIPVTSDGSGDSVAIPDLRYYTKLQNVMDRIFVSGGRFGDQLRTLFGTNSNPYTNKPDFLGVWQSTLNPTNTVAMAAGEADGESSVPGQMTARVDSYSDFGGRKIDYYAKEPGTVMFISFLVPVPAYSQGLHPDLAVTTFADEFNPEMKGLGFQSVPRWRYSTLPDSFATSNNVWVAGAAGSVDPNLNTVGDTVAFDWLKTDYARLHGEFATGGYFDYWTLRRRFTDYWEDVNPSTGALNAINVGEYYGTYINPLSWQYIFFSQSLLDPNFFVGFNFNLKVTSSVPANYMPYLGR